MLYDSFDYFNFAEGCFWIFLGIVALYSYQKFASLYRRLSAFSALVFITFGVSDFVQVVLGSFLVPGMEWLLLWKIIDVVGICVGVAWYLYLRLTQSSSTVNSTDTGQ